MSLKTSVYLTDDLVERWKATGMPLAEVVRLGLDARLAGRGLIPPPDPAGGMEKVIEAAYEVCNASAETGKQVGVVSEQVGTLLGLLRDQGYVIVPKAELAAQLQALMAMASTGLQAGGYRLVKIEEDDGKAKLEAMGRDIEERYGHNSALRFEQPLPGIDEDIPPESYSGPSPFYEKDVKVHGTMTGRIPAGPPDPQDFPPLRGGVEE